MPVILALSIALIASVLGMRMTLSVQFLLDHLEHTVEAQNNHWEADEQLDHLLEALSRSNGRVALTEMKNQGWQIEGSGRYFNPLTWLNWNDEQRLRFSKGSVSSSLEYSAWLSTLDQLKKCFPVNAAERQSMFDDCTPSTLPQGMALFPEPSALDLNEASVSQLKMMVPEISAGLWETLDRQRMRSPFISMADFNERLPEIASISPLPESFDVKSRYLWVKWKKASGQSSFVWLIDRQGSEGSKIRFMRKE